jgi:hypothetical protein
MPSLSIKTSVVYIILGSQAAIKLINVIIFAQAISSLRHAHLLSKGQDVDACMYYTYTYTTYMYSTALSMIILISGPLKPASAYTGSVDTRMCIQIMGRPPFQRIIFHLGINSRPSAHKHPPWPWINQGTTNATSIKDSTGSVCESSLHTEGKQSFRPLLETGGRGKHSTFLITGPGF